MIMYGFMLLLSSSSVIMSPWKNCDQHRSNVIQLLLSLSLMHEALEFIKLDIVIFLLICLLLKTHCILIVTIFRIWNTGAGKFWFLAAILNSIIYFVTEMIFENSKKVYHCKYICLVSIYLNLKFLALYKNH